MGWPIRVAPFALGGAAAAVAGWRIADQMLEPPVAEITPDDGERVEVVAVDDDSVRLRGPAAGRPGRWALKWDGGAAQVGPVSRRLPSDEVVRPLRTFGAPPPAGTRAWLSADGWPEDPSALGVPWEELTYRSPAGSLPAWRFGAGADAASRTWAICVHGRGGRRGDVIKYVPSLTELGLPTLVITLRNAIGSPPSRDRLLHLGHTEWQDVEAAVVHALSGGARDVVLLGASMGGAAVGAFLRTSAHAGAVRAVVLDAPALHWPPLLWLAAERRGVPAVLLPAVVPAALAMMRLRAGIDWSALDHIGHANEFRHPMLVLHGEEDDRVPIGLSETFARRRPDLVTLVRVPGAGHLQAWNVQPATVERELATFLRVHLARRRAEVGRARRTLTRLHRRAVRRT